MDLDGRSVELEVTVANRVGVDLRRLRLGLTYSRWSLS
jgi:hypothetical protein